jgi:DNA-binding response OmpR family regulator
MSTTATKLARILVIDDDPAVNRMIGTTLRSHGFTVASAHDGSAGLTEVESQGPDVIILDLAMPVMDGRTFFRELRARGDMTPVLILSAFGARDAARELCAEGYVQKPFRPDELADKIRSVLERAA